MNLLQEARMLKSREIICGVYRIIHLPTMQIYIGGSVDVLKRIVRQHCDLRFGNNRNKPMQKIANEQGLAGFVWELPIVCERHELDDLETKTIQAAMLTGRCLNVIPGAKFEAGKVPTSITEKTTAGARNYWSDPKNRERASTIRIGRKQTPEHVAKTVALHAHPFKVRAPDGTIHTGVNKAKFARERGLPSSAFCSMFVGYIKHCRGWTPVVD